MMHGDDRDQRIATWLDSEAPDSIPDVMLRAAFARTQATRQVPRAPRLVHLPIPRSWATVAVIAGAVVVVAVAIGFAGSRDGSVAGLPAGTQVSGSSSPVAEPTATPGPTPTLVPSDLGGEIAIPRKTGAEVDLYSVRLDGSASTRLTTAPGAETDAAWSPDGASLVFVRTAAGRTDLFKVRADGMDETRLTRTPDVETTPAFSPDGTRIAFARGTGATATDLYVMDADGGEPQLVYRQLGGFVGNPRWSPDAGALYFNRDLSAGGGIGIVRLDLRTAATLDLTPTAGESSSFALSPDGTRIAFQSDRTPGGIFVMNADGSHVVHLVGDWRNGRAVDWSPDGSHLVYAGPDGWLYLIPMAGGEPVRWAVASAAAWRP